MTLGAVVSIVPFLWMLSVSFMSLGETASGQLITNQALIEAFNYTPEQMDATLRAGLPDFVKATDNIRESDLNMTVREYAIDRNSYWVVGETTVLRGGVVNYLTAWDEANFGRYFLNSVIMTALQVLGQTLFSILAAYAFARMEFPGRDLLFNMFLLTLFIPATIILIPNYLTVVGLNEAFNNFYASVGLTDLAKSIGLRWIDGWFGLVVPFLASTFGIFLLRQFFRQIPDELYDAARIDGAGHTRFLFQVVVPIARASIVTIILFTFLAAVELPGLADPGHPGSRMAADLVWAVRLPAGEQRRAEPDDGRGGDLAAAGADRVLLHPEAVHGRHRHDRPQGLEWPVSRSGRTMTPGAVHAPGVFLLLAPS